MRIRILVIYHEIWQICHNVWMICCDIWEILLLAEISLKHCWRFSCSWWWNQKLVKDSLYCITHFILIHNSIILLNIQFWFYLWHLWLSYQEAVQSCKKTLNYLNYYYQWSLSQICEIIYWMNHFLSVLISSKWHWLLNEFLKKKQVQVINKMFNSLKNCKLFCILLNIFLV